MASELHSALCYLMEQAVAKALPVLPKLQASLRTLEGKAMQITLRDLPISLVCVVQAGTLRVYAHYGSEPDVQLTMNSLDLLRMLGDSKANLFAMEVEVTGEMAVAQAYQEAFANVHFDVQDLFARGPSSLLATVTQATKQAAKQTGAHWQEEASQQLTKTLVAEKSQLERFVGDVDALRAQLDRLGARMDKLGP